MNSINAVMLPKEIMFANTTKVNHCHCEEFDDPFDELRAGCGNQSTPRNGPNRFNNKPLPAPTAA